MKAQFLFDQHHPVLKDHTLYGHHLMPGLAYLDFLYQFFRANGHGFSGLELRDFTIYRPLIVRDDGPLVCEIEATGQDDGVWQVTIHAEGRPARASAPRMKYVSIRVHSIQPRDFTDVIDIGQLRSRASTGIDLDDIYARCRNLELIQKGFMKPDGTVYMQGDTMMAEVRVGGKGSANTNGIMFHPAIMDAAAVCSAWAVGLSGNALGGLSLPLFVRSFRATALIQNHCFVRARLQSVQHKGDVRYMTIEFFDASGHKVAEVVEMASKLVRDPGQFDPARVLQPLQQAPAPAQPFASSRQEGARAARAFELEHSLRQLVARRLHRRTSEISLHMGYYEMGLDSSALLELVRSIEEMIGAELTPTLLFEYTTIAELAAHLAALTVRGLDVENAKPIVDEAAPGERFRRGAEVQLTPRTHERDIAIISVAGRFPQARNVAEFWERRNRRIPPHRG